MITYDETEQERTQSIFRRIHELPSNSAATARAMYETKRSILKKLMSRLRKHRHSGILVEPSVRLCDTPENT